MLNVLTHHSVSPKMYSFYLKKKKTLALQNTLLNPIWTNQFKMDQLPNVKVGSIKLLDNSMGESFMTLD
jgi:hypothetical protein